MAMAAGSGQRRGIKEEKILSYARTMRRGVAEEKLIRRLRLNSLWF